MEPAAFFWDRCIQCCIQKDCGRFSAEAEVIQFPSGAAAERNASVHRGRPRRYPEQSGRGGDTACGYAQCLPGFVTEKKALVEFGERFIQGAAALVDRSRRMDGDAVRTGRFDIKNFMDWYE